MTTYPTPDFPAAYGKFWQALRKAGVKTTIAYFYLETSYTRVRHVLQGHVPMSLAKFAAECAVMRMRYKDVWQQTKGEMCAAAGFDPETGLPLPETYVQIDIETRQKPKYRDRGGIQPYSLPIYESEQARQKSLEISQRAQKPKNNETVGACIFYLLEDYTTEEKLAMLGIPKKRWSGIVHSHEIPSITFLKNCGWLDTIRERAREEKWQGPYGQKLCGYVEGTWTPDILPEDRYREARKPQKILSGLGRDPWATGPEVVLSGNLPTADAPANGKRRVKHTGDEDEAAFEAFCRNYPSLCAGDPAFARLAFEKSRAPDDAFASAGQKTTWRESAARVVRGLREESGLQMSADDVCEPMGDFAADCGGRLSQTIDGFGGLSEPRWRQIEAADPTVKKDDYLQAIKTLCRRCRIDWEKETALNSELGRQARALIDAAARPKKKASAEGPVHGDSSTKQAFG